MCNRGAYADYQKTFPAGESVSGEADTFDQPVAGNINQLRELKKKHPQLKIIWSFGGWTWSGGFGQAASDPDAFAKSCHDLVEDSRWPMFSTASTSTGSTPTPPV